MNEPTTRRAVLEKLAYVAPAILTIKVIPALASAGSNPTLLPDDPIPTPPTGHHHNRNNKWNPW
jgi:hypothetical protein